MLPERFDCCEAANGVAVPVSRDLKISSAVGAGLMYGLDCDDTPFPNPEGREFSRPSGLDSLDLPILAGVHGERGDLGVPFFRKCLGGGGSPIGYSVLFLIVMGDSGESISGVIISVGTITTGLVFSLPSRSSCSSSLSKLGEIAKDLEPALLLFPPWPNAAVLSSCNDVPIASGLLCMASMDRAFCRIVKQPDLLPQASMVWILGSLSRKKRIL